MEAIAGERRERVCVYFMVGSFERGMEASS